MPCRTLTLMPRLKVSESVNPLITIERLTIKLIGDNGPTCRGLLLVPVTVVCTVVRLIIVGMLAKLRTNIWVGWHRTLWLE